ncbi:5-keto 4-deoxyuronate isomerase [uncultured Alphaproteobacteria bacterium]|uniref:4-deoxy-L-threo-5-hexosulose-uronate ketol-isomerase n=1 Tax=uncultured Alphaproteobacteria bacterium TaxID=91750 RepID=A0A212KMF5_9PROT|nr:5-keto 4-deoxyuronate isomerase [uncultured Alphaproteobacteria bacterium]
MLDIRHPSHPEDAKHYTTDRLRKEFLIQNIFVPGQVNLTYSHVDRVVAGGACPAGEPLALVAPNDFGVDSFLERRELGLINVGGPGVLTVDGESHELEKTDGFYVGMGTKSVVFASKDAKTPAKFYLVSSPAHHTYPSVKILRKDIEPVRLGDQENSNKRSIYKYIQPATVKSCQLVMGMTALEPGNMWNSMPCHTHERRMEVYFYFDLPETARVVHFMGEPSETRHIFMSNEEAVISPSWSIHSGVGTHNYTFIWGMAGENQTFDDMDHVAMPDLR